MKKSILGVCFVTLLIFSSVVVSASISSAIENWFKEAFLSPTCSDPDGGLIYTAKGTTTQGTNIKTDYCASDGSLREHYCNAAGNLQVLQHWCESGKTCSDGKCIARICPPATVSDYAGLCTVADIGKIKCANNKLYSCLQVSGTTCYFYSLTALCSNMGANYQCNSAGTACVQGTTCIPNCAGKNCGENGCGGSCGICQSGQTCSNGVCASSGSGCYDSDGSSASDWKLSVKGYTTFNGASQTWDSCQANGNVLERICLSGSAEPLSMPCPTGQTCSNGVCVISQSCINECPSGEKRCSANNYQICMDGNSDSCLEWWTAQRCGSSATCNASKEINSVCVPNPNNIASCTETDNGIIFGVKGVTTKGALSCYDSCNSDGSLQECYCNGTLGNVLSIKYNCPSGQTCLNGECVSSNVLGTCTESDDGIAYDVKGTATNASASCTDSCSQDGGIVECYCSAGKVYTSRIGCQSGKICSDGACIYSSSCANECSSGDAGCSEDSKQNWACGISALTSCWEKSYTSCPSGQTCFNGKCGKCSDPDNGKNVNKRGCTSLNGENQQCDVCSTNQRVTETFCVDGVQSSSNMPCPAGKRCILDGECVSLGLIQRIRDWFGRR